MIQFGSPVGIWNSPICELNLIYSSNHNAAGSKLRWKHEKIIGLIIFKSNELWKDYEKKYNISLVVQMVIFFWGQKIYYFLWNDMQLSSSITYVVKRHVGCSHRVRSGVHSFYDWKVVCRFVWNHCIQNAWNSFFGEPKFWNL